MPRYRSIPVTQGCSFSTPLYVGKAVTDVVRDFLATGVVPSPGDAPLYDSDDVFEVDPMFDCRTDRWDLYEHLSDARDLQEFSRQSRIQSESATSILSSSSSSAGGSDTPSTGAVDVSSTGAVDV